MNVLYIFVTTDRPDQYLNSIVYCTERETRKVIFVQVEDKKTKSVPLNLLKNNIYGLLQNLSRGCYKYYIGNLEGTTIELKDKYKDDELAKLKARYSRCLTDSIRWDIKRVPYLKLRKFLSMLRKEKGDFIIDVTAVSKGYLGDIYACSLLEGIERLHTFELPAAPNFDKPWRTLIHHLEKEAKEASIRNDTPYNPYKYTNLVETPIFEEGRKSILIRTVPLLVSVVGTVVFVGATLIITSIFGFSSFLVQAISVIGTVLGIVSFFLIYFPVRSR